MSFQRGTAIEWVPGHGLDQRSYDERLAFFLEMKRPMTPGVVRKVAPPDLQDPKVQEEVDESKRNILKLMAIGGLAAVAAGGAVGAALQYVQPPMQGLASYPRVQLLYSDGTPVQVANIDSHIDPTSTDAFLFQYPLEGEPNFLLNLQGKYGKPPSSLGPSPGGNFIVAYSAICQHLGCIPPFLSFYPSNVAEQCQYNGGAPFLHCVCHGSTYDPYVQSNVSGGGANILTGPTVLPLPQVILDTDTSGNIFAVKNIGPDVKGHFQTLLGGNPGPVPAPLAKTSVPPYGTSGSTQRCP